MDINLRKNQGFSVIELIIVLVIVGVLSVSPLIKINTSSMINLGAQAFQIANDIRLAQALAMSKNQRYYFIRQSASTYQIINASTATAILFPTGLTTVTTNTGITFTTNLPSNLVAFDGRGIPYTTTTTPGTALGAAGTVTVTAGSSSKIISIAPTTGQITIT